jgi:predicted transcriptional regulator
MANLNPTFANRFGQVHLGVLASLELTATDKTVYGIIASHRNHRTGTAFPSRDLIAKLAGLHVNSVSRSMRRLEDLGFIERQHHGGPGNRTTYRFPLFDRDKPATAIHVPAQTTALVSAPVPCPAEVYSNRSVSEPAPAPILSNQTITTPSGIESYPHHHSDTSEQGKPEEKSALRGCFLEKAEKEPEQEPDSQNGTCDDQNRVPDLHQGRNDRVGQATAPERHANAMTYPTTLSPGLIPAFLAALASIPSQADKQTLLDELEGAMQMKEIRNPVGWLRSIARLFLVGQFIPEHAGRVQRERKRREIARANVERHTHRPPDRPIQASSPSTQGNSLPIDLSAKIADLRAALKGRAH